MLFFNEDEGFRKEKENEKMSGGSWIVYNERRTCVYIYIPYIYIYIPCAQISSGALNDKG